MRIPQDAGKAAEETGAKRTYADYTEMLAVEDLDIVSVCPRWVDCHEEMVMACAEAGCHVYCEKPMAASLDSADRIVEAADRAGVKVAVAHQAVYLPQVQRIREMVEEGKIGRIHSFHSSGKQDHRGGGEDLMVLGTHLFNLMRFFAGDVAWMFGHVTAEGKDIEACHVREAGEPIGPIAGDFVETIYAFKSGATGHFVSRARGGNSGSHYGLEIAGEAGRIAFNADASMVTLMDDDAHRPWDSAQEREALSLGDSPLSDGNRLAILDLIDAVENDRDPRSSASRRPVRSGDDPWRLRVADHGGTGYPPNGKPPASSRTLEGLWVRKRRRWNTEWPKGSGFLFMCFMLSLRVGLEFLMPRSVRGLFRCAIYHEVNCGIVPPATTA